MNWVCSVAVIVVSVAVALRLLWWARSHRLASQRQTSAENPTELCKTTHGADVSDKAPGKVEAQSKKM
jgi:hypothetical protein